jgi:hypothetical protein
MQTSVGPSVLPLVGINFPAIGWLGWAHRLVCVSRGALKRAALLVWRWCTVMWVSPQSHYHKDCCVQVVILTVSVCLVFIDSVVLPAHGDTTTVVSVYYNSSLNILVVNLPLKVLITSKGTLMNTMRFKFCRKCIPGKVIVREVKVLNKELHPCNNYKLWKNFELALHKWESKMKGSNPYPVCCLITSVHQQ